LFTKNGIYTVILIISDLPEQIVADLFYNRKSNSE